MRPHNYSSTEETGTNNCEERIEAETWQAISSVNPDIISLFFPMLEACTPVLSHHRSLEDYGQLMVTRLTTWLQWIAVIKKLSSRQFPGGNNCIYFALTAILIAANLQPAHGEESQYKDLRKQLDFAVQSKEEKLFFKIATEILGLSRKSGERDPGYLDSFEIIGRHYLSLSRFVEARPCLSRALQIRRMLPRADGVEMELADALLNLANAELGCAQFEQADSHAQEALNIERLHLPNGHAKIAQTLEIVVTSENALNRLVELEMPAKELITIKTRAKELGTISGAIMALARSLIARSRRAEAQEFLKLLSLPMDHTGIRLTDEYLTLAAIEVSLERYERVHPLLLNARDTLSKMPAGILAGRKWIELAAAFMWPGVDDEQAAYCYRRGVDDLKKSSVEDVDLTQPLLELHQLYLRLNNLSAIDSLEQELAELHARTGALKRQTIEVGVASNLYVRFGEDVARGSDKMFLERWLQQHQSHFPGLIGQALQQRIRGQACSAESQPVRAIEHYQACLKILASTPGAEKERASCSRRIAVSYLQLGLNKDALHWAQKALLEAEQAKNVQLADEGYRQILADALTANGQLQQALDQLNRECAEYAKRKPLSPNLVRTLQDRASLLIMQGDLAGASTAANDLLALSLLQGIPNASNYQIFANLHLMEHRFSVASEFIKLALLATKGQQVLSAGGNRLSPINRATLYMNLGTSQSQLGHYEEASDSYHRALKIIDSTTSLTRCRLAIDIRQRLADNTAHLNPADKQTILSYARSAMTLAEKNFGLDSSFWFESLNQYARKLLQTGDKQKAKEILGEYLQSSKERLGNSCKYIDYLQQTADSLQLTGSYQEAEDLYSKIAELAQTVQPHQPLRQSDALTGRAQIKLRHQLFAAADVDLARALMIRRNHYPPGDPSIVGNLEALAFCADKLGHPQAESYRKQLKFQLSKRTTQFQYLLADTYVNLPNPLEPLSQP